MHGDEKNVWCVAADRNNTNQQVRRIIERTEQTLGGHVDLMDHARFAWIVTDLASAPWRTTRHPGMGPLSLGFVHA